METSNTPYLLTMEEDTVSRLEWYIELRIASAEAARLAARENNVVKLTDRRSKCK